MDTMLSTVRPIVERIDENYRVSIGAQPTFLGCSCGTAAMEIVDTSQ
jgi:hypothetical protein